MKKQYNLAKLSLLITTILAIIETIILFIEFSTRQIILSLIVYIGFIVTLFIFIILRKAINAMKNLIFIYEDEIFSIRLIDQDDYQHLRVLLDKSELTNSQEEVEKIEKYRSLLKELIDKDYHYIVLKNNIPSTVFYSQEIDDVFNISFLSSPSDEIIDLLNTIAKKVNVELKIKE